MYTMIIIISKNKHSIPKNKQIELKLQIVIFVCLKYTYDKQIYVTIAWEDSQWEDLVLVDAKAFVGYKTLL